MGGKSVSGEKIKLEICDTYDDDKRIKNVGYALPYYLSRQGKYHHRVRYAHNHWRDGSYSHTSVHFWFGNSGFIGKKGRLYLKVPDDGVLCATCEGKAIGAGLDGAREINGKKVMYSPKRDNQHTEG